MALWISSSFGYETWNANIIIVFSRHFLEKEINNMCLNENLFQITMSKIWKEMYYYKQNYLLELLLNLLYNSVV